MTFEDTVRAYEEAKRTYDDEVRRWLAAQDPKPVTEDDFTALERRYTVEHCEEAAAVEAAFTEVAVARAALDRRWIEAHEDLAVFRKGGVLPSR